MGYKIIDVFFELVITLQFLQFVLFVLLNLSNLTAINVPLTISGITYNFVINFWDFLGIIGAIFVVIILISINVMGSGINDEGTKNVSKYIGFVLMFVIFSIGTLFFMQYIKIIATFFFIFSVFAYVLKIINTLTEV